MIIIQKVIEHLDINREKILSELSDVLRLIFTKEHKKPINEADINKKKIDSINSKKEKLLDLYLNDILSKEEYRQKKENYETEISQLETVLLKASNKSQDNYDCDIAIKDIEQHMNKMLYGTEINEIFYRNFIENIVVYDRKHFDVYINLLPHKWQVIVSELIDGRAGVIFNQTYLYQ